MEPALVGGFGREKIAEHVNTLELRTSPNAADASVYRPGKPGSCPRRSMALQNGCDPIEAHAKSLLVHPDPVKCHERPDSCGEWNEPEEPEAQDDDQFGHPDATHGTPPLRLCVSR